MARAERYETAVERLENSRCRLLAEDLALWQSHASHVSNGNSRIRDVARAVRRTEAEMATMSLLPESGTGARFQQLSVELQKAKAELLKHGNPPMGRPAQYSEIAALAPAGEPWVYLTVTPAGSMAIIVPPRHGSLDRQHVVWLDQFDSERVKRDFLAWNGGPSILLNLWNMETGGLGNGLSDFLNGIWRDVMKPLTLRLRYLGYSSARLIACQEFSAMPIHAAFACEPEAEHQPFTWSYAPCARTARQRRAAKSGQSSLLGVAVTDGNSEGMSNDSGRLPYVVAEVNTVARRFADHSLLCDQQAIKGRLVNQLERKPSHVHFACHGTFVPPNTLASHLLLAEGTKLHAADLAGLDLSTTELVVLSACQSGLADTRNAQDELVGFASAFLKCGVQAVIASQWRVRDDATAILMAKFYHNHIGLGRTPERALSEAQMWLRQATAKELRLAEWYQAAERRATKEQRDRMKHTVAYFGQQPNELPFEHPFFWAGFVCLSL